MLFRLSLITILVGCLSLASASSLPAADGAPAVAVRTRPRVAASPAYAIRDIGMPSPDTYPSSAPVGFNNTGQIFGVALRAGKSDRLSYLSDTDCLVWTGLTFVDVEASLTVQRCMPYAMNSATSSGAFTVVGAFNDIRHLPPDQGYANAYDDAFTATIGASGSVTTVPFYQYSPAALFGINAAGIAVGISYNPIQPRTLFVTAPGERLAYLQPNCSATVGCIVAIQFLLKRSDGQPTGQCAFGGCSINASGTVIGVDTATYALYTNGVAGSKVDLPVPAGRFGAVVALNDASQITYFIGPTAFLYDANAGTTTAIPPVAGTSCGYYTPISLNNSGTVLGFASDCKSKPFYFTWDPGHGTQDLNLQIPANAYTIKAFGINDNGQILVSLRTSAGATHWGTLDPAGAPATPRGMGAKERRHAH
jgi:hypothetical protein